MQTWQFDVATLGFVGTAASAVIAAGVKAFLVAAKFGRSQERAEQNAVYIAMIPGIKADLASVTSSVGQLTSNLARLDEGQKKHHSEMHELRERLAVEEAIREHSQGSYGE